MLRGINAKLNLVTTRAVHGVPWSFILNKDASKIKSTSEICSSGVLPSRGTLKSPSASSGKIDPARFWEEDAEGGDGGGSNGKNFGGGGDGDDFGGDDDAGFGGKALLLVTLAAAVAVVMFKLYHRKKRSASEASALPESYDSDDVRTLKRLLREVFAELVNVRSRLEEVEGVAGIKSAETNADATPLSTSKSFSSSISPGATEATGAKHPPFRQTLSGALKFGAGALWDEAEESGDAVEGQGLGAVQAAGVGLGTDLMLQLGSTVRGGSDAVLAEVKIDPGDESFSLHKVLYNCKVAPGLRLILSPFGARGQDVAYTLNPFAGQGLVSTVKHGSPLYQRVLGAVIGATADLKRAWLSAAFFSQAAEDGTASDTVFLQAVVAPLSALSLGLTMVEPVGAPSVPGGPVQLTGIAEGTARPMQEQGTRQLGATAAMAFGDIAVHGWTAAAADSLESRNFHNAQWGVTMAPRPDGSATSWALGIGKVAAGGSPTASPVASDTIEALQPNIMELSTQFDLGDGMLLTPGLVVMRRGGQHTVYAGVKTSWVF